jgi:signal transduction histidine kinase
MNLHDSGLTDSRLLARLLQASVLVLDTHRGIGFASPGACELLGTASEAELRSRWTDIAAQLGVASWPPHLPDGAAYNARADLVTARGPRAIRFEVHNVERGHGTQRIILLRERDQLLPSDRALLLASEAQATRHALTGLVHAAKGPLNNFTLTLALLASGIERNGEGPLAASSRERWQRYLEVLRNETVRLAASLDEIHSLALPAPASRESIDIVAMLRDVARVLHHDAALREIDLEADAPATAVTVVGDPRLVKLALLVFTICVLDLTPAQARVTWRVTPPDARERMAVLAITTSQGSLPADLVTSLFRLTCTAESPYSAAIAGRLIVEAQGGDVSIQSDAPRKHGFVLRIPLAPS